MIYNPLYSINDFNILADNTSSSEPRVKVYYNNSGLHEIAGPVPFVRISESPLSSDNGDLFSSKVSIGIEGKIAYTGTTGSGISGVMNAISSLRALFYGGSGAGFSIDAYNREFSIKCDGTNYIRYSGVRILSFDASPSPDNWTNSANYNIELETYVPRYSGLYNIKSASEDWTIEPLDDYVYYTSGAISGSGQSITDARVSSAYSVDLISLPQYRVSRKLSAVGFVGYNNSVGISGTHDAYLEAKKWVMDRVKISHSGTDYTKPYMNFGGSNFLYNHLRSTNFSINAGSYEINDTWLAMPTGIGYTEEYTVNSSSDTKNIKSVQVQGEIKGLALANWNLESLSDIQYSFPPSGNSLALYSGMKALPRTTGATHPFLDALSGTSPNNTIVAHKYINALSGWLNDIKPYLYNRAVIGSLGSGRNVGPYPYNLSSASVTIGRPNPIFCQDNLLNIIPVSFSETHDPKKGIINYSYEYSNKFKHISGVITEHISLNDNSPADVISEAFILGRRLGPALQNLGSRTSTRRELSIEITVVPPSSIAGFVYTNKECPLWTGGIIHSGITGLIGHFRPFSTTRSSFLNMSSYTSGLAYVAGDQASWDPIQGRYTRTVSWLYQPCAVMYNTLSS